MRQSINRRTVLSGIGAAGLAALAGCLEGDDDEEDLGLPDLPDEPDEIDELRIGVLAPVTGDLGDLGGPIADAGELPGEQLAGEIDWDIDIRVEDTETLTDVGVDRAQALADAGYPSVTGAAASDVTLPVSQDIYVEEEIVGISPASTAPEITEVDGRYMLRTTPSDALQGVAAAEVAFQDEGAETAATFHLNDAYGEGLSTEFAAAFEDEGGEILTEEAFEPEQPSYDSELEVVLEEEPDLLYVVAFPDSGEQIFRDFYESFDLDIPVMVPDGLQENDLPANVDNPMENVLGTAPSPTGPGLETFIDLYNDEFGRDPGVFNAEAYDATILHMLAQVRAGSHEGPEVAAGVREVANPGGEVVGPDNLDEAFEMAANGDEIEYQGASSEIEFDENGDLATATFDIFEFSADGYTVTDSIEM